MTTPFSKLLDERVRALAEKFEMKLGEAHNQIAEGFEGRVEALIERFGQRRLALG